MPYCPKCDMEFIEGITKCSDCGGPLVESKEVADAMKKKQKEKEYERQRTQYEAMQAAMAQQQAAAQARGEAAPEQPLRREPSVSNVYVKQSQRYDDYKSSASAFFLVGVILTVACILCWTGIVNLPLIASSKYLIQSVLTFMGVGFLIIGFKSLAAAKEVSGAVKAEENKTKDLVNWFVSTYTKEQIDGHIMRDYGDLPEEEMSLKRFYIIHDLIVVNKKISDESYLDLLCEDIYSKMYED